MQFMTIKQFIESKKYPISMGKMRKLLAKREDNGFNFVVRRMGKKLLIRPDLFEQWLDMQKEEK